MDTGSGNARAQTTTVQYSTVQYSTVQYSTVQYSTVQYSTVQYSTVQYSTVQYSTVQYSTVQYSTVQYSTVQYSTVQYSTVQCSTVQYSTVQCSCAQRNKLQKQTNKIMNENKHKSCHSSSENILIEQSFNSSVTPKTVTAVCCFVLDCSFDVQSTTTKRHGNCDGLSSDKFYKNQG